MTKTEKRLQLLFAEQGRLWELACAWEGLTAGDTNHIAYRGLFAANPFAIPYRDAILEIAWLQSE